MNAITEEIKEALTLESKEVIKEANLLWVDNYENAERGFVLPIAAFIGKGVYYFVTGVSVYSLNSRYKEMATFEEIANAVWQLYINQ